MMHRTPTGVVVRPSGGPGPVASLIAASATIGLTALTFLLAAAILLPAPYGTGAPVTGAASTPPGTTAPGATAPIPGTPPPSVRPGTSGVPAARPTEPANAPAAPAASPATARLRASAPLRIDGRAAGRVSVQALRAATRPGVELAPDERVLVATVRFAATSRLRYDAGDWQLEDETGDRWDALPGSPTDPLGSGTLEPSEAHMGTVAFKVPRDRGVRSVVLTDGAGTDLVVFARVQASS